MEQDFAPGARRFIFGRRSIVKSIPEIFTSLEVGLRRRVSTIQVRFRSHALADSGFASNIQEQANKHSPCLSKRYHPTLRTEGATITEVAEKAETVPMSRLRIGAKRYSNCR